MSRVLVLDGGQRKSLAAVRSLAMRGDEVYVGDSRTVSLAGWSRYSSGTVRLPKAGDHDFLEAVERMVRAHRFDVGMPTHDQSTQALAGRDRIGDAGLYVPGADLFRIRRANGRTLQAARQAADPI